MGNGKAGVLISGSDRVALQDNLISGNDGHGVELSGSADYTKIDRNIIGGNASGTSDLGNTGSGIHISNGDGASISDNIIVGNDSHGVSLTGSSTTDNLIAENHIGVNENGASIANSGSGVHIGGSSNDNDVERNTIAHNTADGVTVVSNSSTVNTVWENSIYSNGGLGIDLNDDGVTANDTNDPDRGPNNLQNFAVLTSAGLSSDAGSIGFNLYVTRDNRYIVDFYASDSCDASGNGEGKEWLGFAIVAPKTFGDRDFVVNTFRGTLNQYEPPSGSHITATVSAGGSTSEFSPCVQSTTLPRLTLSEDTIEMEEDGTTTTYTVRLASQPSHEAMVDLTIEGDEAVTVSPDSLTFTVGNNGNWQTPQPVTVTAVSDDDPEDAFTVIQHKLTINSKEYVSEWLPVQVQDDDVPGAALVINGNHRVVGFVTLEERQMATYPVVLTEEPEDDVTISVSTSNSSTLRVAPSSLTFTKDDYSMAQNVTITARTDSDAEDELVTVYHDTPIDGTNYELLRVLALVKDSIFPGLTASEDALSVNEGDTATYTVVLDSDPARTVIIRPTSTDTESVTVSPSSLTFTTGTNGDWDTEQTVRVTAVQDDDEFDDVALIRHFSTYSGEEYRLGSAIQVTVADGNRAPSFEDGLETIREVPENSAAGTNVGDPITATDLNTGDILGYTLDDPSGKFAISSTTGQITVVAADSLDYETEQDYSMDVEVAETGTSGLGDKIEVKVLVTNVNEPPTVSGDAMPSFAENTSTSRVLDRYTATDPERSSITWSVEGTDKDAFTIDNRGNLRFSGQQDFETKEELSITIVGTDEGDPPERGEFEVTVTLTNVDDPPAIAGDDNLTFAENTQTTTILQSYTASDPEGVTSTFTWSLSGTDRGDFDLSSTGELTFRNVPDYDRPADSGGNNEYNVQIRANDGSLTGTLDVTVNVTNINEPPAISGSNDLEWRENRSGNITRYTATDPERQSFEWSVIGTDFSHFSIDSRGYLTFNDPPNFENKLDSDGDGIYEPTVVARDSEGQFGTLNIRVTVTDVNEPPTIFANSGFTTYAVDEIGESFGQFFTASDPDDTNTQYSWSLSGSDAGDFLVIEDIVNSERAELIFRDTRNYESPADSNRDNEYLVTVRATDEGGIRGTLDITVKVEDVNEPPTITGNATPPNFPENSVRSVATYRASDPERRTITWSVAGKDAGDFEISDSGVLTFVSIPDFEMPVDDGQDNTYDIQVVATDDGNLRDGTPSQLGTLSVRFDVAVNVINSTGTEEPTITATSRPALTFRENGTGTVYSFRSRDPQGRPVEWSVTGDDSGEFEIGLNTGVLTFRSPPDFEIPTDSGNNNVYEITVVVTDDQGLTDSFDLTISVTDVNEGPEISRAGGTPGSVPENQEQIQVLARYSARDPEDPTAQITRWSTSGTDGGDFVMNEQGELRFRNTPDHERPADSNGDNVYVFTVRAHDGRVYGSFDETVTVDPVNEPPTITTTSSSATALRQNENQTSRLYTYRATDPEGEAVTWLVGGVDSRFFSIDIRGQFSFKENNGPDFEQPGDSGGDNVYDVEIQARDSGGITARLPVRVTVREVNEGPEVTSGRDAFTIDENQDLPNAVYSGFDPEGGVVVRWNLGGRDGGDFTISDAGVMTFRNIPDYERPADSNRDNVYEVQVRPYDGRVFGSFDVTITVTNVNEPPTITTTSRSATQMQHPESRTSRLYAYRATDPEGSPVIWSVGGVDERFFAIDERGQFFFSETDPPDFEARVASGQENVYHVTVQATDVGNNTARLDVTITVTNVNEGPEISRVGSAPGSVPENQAQDTVLARYTATDPEGGAVSRWRTSGTDGGDFVMNEQGELRFRNTPDYDRPADGNRDNVYVFTVQVSDGRNYGSFEETVTVSNINEHDPVIRRGSRTSFTYREDSASVLYTYSASDGDKDEVITWTAGGIDGNLFEFSDRNGLLFKVPPDYEEPADSGMDYIYDLNVVATDSGGRFDSLAVTVTLTDVNEGPEVSGPSSFTISENQNLSNSAYTARDPEGLNVARWGVGGRDGSDFFITQGGTLYFRYLPDYERPADGNRDNVYEVTIRPSDGRYSGSYAVTVTVNGVNEPPEFYRGSRDSFTQPENRVSTLYTYRAADPEGSNVAWSVGGADRNNFTIDEQRGALSFTDPPNFDDPGDVGEDNVYNVTVQARDAQSNTASLEVTVTVTEVDEGPEVSRVGAAPGSVQENQAQTRVLATYSARDPERPTVQVATWSTSGRDGGDFVITPWDN